MITNCLKAGQAESGVPAVQVAGRSGRLQSMPRKSRKPQVLEVQGVSEGRAGKQEGGLKVCRLRSPPIPSCYVAESGKYILGSS